MTDMDNRENMVTVIVAGIVVCMLMFCFTKCAIQKKQQTHELKLLQLEKK